MYIAALKARHRQGLFYSFCCVFDSVCPEAVQPHMSLWRTFERTFWSFGFILEVHGDDSMAG